MSSDHQTKLHMPNGTGGVAECINDGVLTRTAARRKPNTSTQEYSFMLMAALTHSHCSIIGAPLTYEDKKKLQGVLC